jgi:alkylation response protein AidB-like acyl-CoA dehydrogenase
MDFTFSEEQDMLRRAVRSFVRERYPIERVAAIADGPGFDRSEWRELGELGWIGIAVTEERGGSGLAFLDQAVIIEELGRGLYPGPYLSSAVLALSELELCSSGLVDAVASGEQIATVAWAGEDGRFDVDPAPPVDWREDDRTITGIRMFVPDLGVADTLVVLGSADGRTFTFSLDRDAPGGRWRELPTMDRTRRMGEAVLERVETVVGAEDPSGGRALRDRALAALAVEAVGVGSAALDLAVEYAKTREQFGRKIGAFQAVSHPLAQAFMEIETARSLAYWAAWAVSEGSDEAPSAAAAAKARAAEAAVSACERAIQAHGGIGFTWEHPLHRFYKRALGISAFLGWGRELRARVADHVLDSA